MEKIKNSFKMAKFELVTLFVLIAYITTMVQLSGVTLYEYTHLRGEISGFFLLECALVVTVMYQFRNMRIFDCCVEETQKNKGIKC